MKKTMKNFNSISLAVAMFAATFTFSSCQIDDIKGVDSKYVTLALSTETGVETKAATPEVLETSLLEEGDLQLFVTGTVALNDVDPFNVVATKGSILKDTDINEVPLTMTYNDGTIYKSGVTGPSNTGDNSYRSFYDGTEKVCWPDPEGSEVFKFWSAFVGAAENVLSVDAEGKIAFNGPATGSTAEDTEDFLVAYTATAHDHAAQNVVPLHYYHALAAVRFKFDLAEGTTVTKVSINNLKNSGKLVFDQTEGADYTTACNTWEDLGGSVSYETDTFAQDNCFFVLPQNLGTSKVTITFTIEKGGKTYQISTTAANLGVEMWKSNCIYTYNVSNSNDGVVGIQVDENFDTASDKKSNVKVTNNKRSSVYVRARVVAHWATPAGRIMEPYTGSLNYNTTDWALGSDGSYYSLKPIKGYSSSADIIGDFTGPTDATKAGLNLVVSIMAQAVECDEFALGEGKASSVAEAWPGVTIGGVALATKLAAF